jgi:hypothetical protein
METSLRLQDVSAFIDRRVQYTECLRNIYRKLEGEYYGQNKENSLYKHGSGNVSVRNWNRSKMFLQQKA